MIITVSAYYTFYDRDPILMNSPYAPEVIKTEQEFIGLLLAALTQTAKMNLKHIFFRALNPGDFLLPFWMETMNEHIDFLNGVKV